MSQKTSNPSASNGNNSSTEEHKQEIHANNADVPSAHGNSFSIPAVDQMVANMLGSFGVGVELPPMNHEYSESSQTYVASGHVEVDQFGGSEAPSNSHSETTTSAPHAGGVAFDISDFTGDVADNSPEFVEHAQEQMTMFYNELVSAPSPEDALALVKATMLDARQKWENALGVDWDEADDATRRGLLKLQYDGMGIGFAKADPMPLVNDPNGFVVQQIISGLGLEISQHILDSPEDQNNFTQCASLSDHFFLHLVRGSIFAPMIGEVFGMMDAHHDWHVPTIMEVLQILTKSMTEAGSACTTFLTRAFNLLRGLFAEFCTRAGRAIDGVAESAGESFAQGIITKFTGVWKKYGAAYARVVTKNLVRLVVQADWSWFLLENAMDSDVWALMSRHGPSLTLDSIFGPFKEMRSHSAEGVAAIASFAAMTFALSHGNLPDSFGMSALRDACSKITVYDRHGKSFAGIWVGIQKVYDALVSWIYGEESDLKLLSAKFPMLVTVVCRMRRYRFISRKMPCHKRDLAQAFEAYEKERRGYTAADVKRLRSYIAELSKAQSDLNLDQIPQRSEPFQVDIVSVAGIGKNTMIVGLREDMSEDYSDIFKIKMGPTDIAYFFKNGAKYHNGYNMQPIFIWDEFFCLKDSEADPNQLSFARQIKSSADVNMEMPDLKDKGMTFQSAIIIKLSNLYFHQYSGNVVSQIDVDSIIRRSDLYVEMVARKGVKKRGESLRVDPKTNWDELWAFNVLVPSAEGKQYAVNPETGEQLVLRYTDIRNILKQKLRDLRDETEVYGLAGKPENDLEAVPQFWFRGGRPVPFGKRDEFACSDDEEDETTEPEWGSSSQMIAHGWFPWGEWKESDLIQRVKEDHPDMFPHPPLERSLDYLIRVWNTGAVIDALVAPDVIRGHCDTVYKAFKTSGDRIPRWLYGPNAYAYSRGDPDVADQWFITNYGIWPEREDPGAMDRAFIMMTVSTRSLKCKPETEWARAWGLAASLIALGVGVFALTKWYKEERADEAPEEDFQGNFDQVRKWTAAQRADYGAQMSSAVHKVAKTRLPDALALLDREEDCSRLKDLLPRVTNNTFVSMNQVGGTFFCLNQSIMIGALHVFEGIEREQGKDTTLRFRRVSGGSVISTGPNTKTAKSYTVVRRPDLDLVAIVWLLKVVQGAADLRKHFVEQADLPVSPSGVAVLGRDGDDVAYRRFNMVRQAGQTYKVAANPSDDECKRRVNEAWFYVTPVRPGFSGGVIALNSKTHERKLCGMHVAGTPERGQGVVLTSEIIDEVCANIPMTPHGLTVIAPRGKFAAYLRNLGHEPWSQAPYLYKQITRNPFSKSCFYSPDPDNLFHTNYDVVKMEPFVDQQGNTIDPLALALTKPLKGIARNPAPVGLDYFGAVADDLVARAPKENIELYQHVPTFEECVKPSLALQLPGVSVRKSGGFPLNGVFPEKSMAFENRDGEQVLTQDALMHLNELEMRLRKRQGIVAVFQDLLKVEKRDRERVAAGKTRIFSAADFFHYILCRKYFSGLRGYMRKFGMAIGVPIGIRSDEFHLLVTRFRKHLNLDFVNFDGSVWPHHFLCFMQLFLRIGVFENSGPKEKVHPDLPPLNEVNVIRWQLLLAIAHAIHQLGDVFYSWGVGNPSGNFLTDIVNAIVVLLNVPVFLSYACRVNGKQLKYEELKKHYELWAFGDDSNTQMSEEVTIDTTALAHVASYHGFEIQAGVKSEAIQFVDLHDSVFLGRMWRMYRGKYWGAMTLDRVVRIPVFIKTTNAVESLVGQAMMMCEELAVHGKMRYEETIRECPFSIPIAWEEVDAILGCTSEGQATQLRGALLARVGAALEEHAQDHGTIFYEGKAPSMVAHAGPAEQTNNEDVSQAPESSTTTNQTVHFEDPDIAVVQDVKPAPSLVVPKHQSYAYADVSKRWFEVTQVIWTTLMSIGDVLYNKGFPSLYFDDNFKAQTLLAMYRWLRCSGKIRIVVNASPFHTGALWAYILYPGQTLPQSDLQKTSNPGALLNVGSASYVELELPAIIRSMYCDILQYQGPSEASMFDFCTVRLEVMSQLRSGTGADAEVSIFAALHDADFMLPTRTDIVMSAQSRELELAEWVAHGLLEEEAATADFLTTADMLRQATGRAIRSIPVVGDAVARIKWMADTSSFALAAAGLSKPARENNSRGVWSAPGYSSATWNGSNQAMPLAGDEESNTVTPASLFSRSEDEANYQVYASRPALMWRLIWQAASASGFVLAEHGLNPASYRVVNPSGGGTARAVGPLGYLANAHKYNRGGMVVILVPISNAMVSGRLAVTINTGSNGITTRAQRAALNTRIWDLKDGKNFEWEVPYPGDGYWANVEPAPHTAITGPWGTMTITVINPLRVSSASMADRIEILIFTRGAVASANSRGFEVAWPYRAMIPADNLPSIVATEAPDRDGRDRTREQKEKFRKSESRPTQRGQRATSSRKGKEPEMVAHAGEAEAEVYAGEALVGVEAKAGQAELFYPYDYMGDEHLWTCMGEQITSWHQFIKRHDYNNYSSGANWIVEAGDSDFINYACRTFAFWSGGLSVKVCNAAEPVVATRPRGTSNRGFQPEIPQFGGKDKPTTMCQVRAPYAGRYPFEYTANINNPPVEIWVGSAAVDRTIGVAADDNFRFGVQVCPPLFTNDDDAAIDDARVAIIP